MSWPVQTLPGSRGSMHHSLRLHAGSDDEGLAAADEEAGLQGQRSRVDAETLQEASHYMSYAFAAYGYLLYLWGKPA